MAIMDIETSLKETKKKKPTDVSMSVLLMLIFAFSFSFAVPSSAITKDNADTEYSKGNYQQAAADYNELLKSKESAELYYNLGNCHYRLGNITQAVIAYEKAQRLSPSDRDIRYNLEFVRSKTIDKITPVDEFFFSSWFKSLVNIFGIGGWTRVAIGSLVLSLIMWLLFFFGTSVWARKTGFYAGIVLAVLFVCSNFSAWHQRVALERHDKAVVTAPTINVKKTPADTGSDAFVIHEGTSVIITDCTMRNWFAITLADGKEGWVKRSQLEVI